MIKNIFLDLDDTIFDFKACERQALSAALSAFDLAFVEDDLSDYSRINDSMWKLLEKGEITREELKTRRFEIFLSRFATPPSAKTFAEEYMRNLADTNALIDGARELLQTLSAKYRLYAVTNGYEVTQKGRLRSAAIEGYFTGIFISQIVGAVKPKREFFDYCVARIPDFALRDTVLVGDSMTSDIAGGKAYGLYSIRFNPYREPCVGTLLPDAEISALAELPALIARL